MPKTKVPQVDLSEVPSNGSGQDEQVFDAEAARKLLALEQRKAEEACLREMAAVLKKHRATLVPQLTLGPKGVVNATVGVVISESG